VTSPSGAAEELSTAAKTIKTTNTCGTKEAGFIEPDFKTNLQLSETGTYHLTLTATTPNGTRQITSQIVVSDAPVITVARRAATRLWPFAPSPMDITVDFAADVDAATITERIPPGFEVENIVPPGVVNTQEDGSTLIHWLGSYTNGQRVTLHYDYDAPDISPQFFLMGPLTIEGAATSPSPPTP
jgi:hypothetical protein